jgi:hypothetical protein
MNKKVDKFLEANEIIIFLVFYFSEK